MRVGEIEKRRYVWGLVEIKEIMCDRVVAAIVGWWVGDVPKE